MENFKMNLGWGEKNVVLANAKLNCAFIRVE